MKLIIICIACISFIHSHKPQQECDFDYYMDDLPECEESDMHPSNEDHNAHEITHQSGTSQKEKSAPNIIKHLSTTTTTILPQAALISQKQLGLLEPGQEQNSNDKKASAELIAIAVSIAIIAVLIIIISIVLLVNLN